VSVQAIAGAAEVSARAAMPVRQLAARPRQARRSLRAPLCHIRMLRAVLGDTFALRQIFTLYA